MRELSREELDFGAGVAARGLRDNPMAVAVIGDDALRRERYMQRSFSGILRAMEQPPLAAWRGDYIVGVAGMATPGSCQLSPLQLLTMMPRVRPTNLGVVKRTVQWVSDWEKRDPDERHWHLGPVAVEGGMRGMGVGSQLMEAFVDRMDRRGDLAYLETDKPENVVFYERFGFEVVDEALVLGARNWFMTRESRAGGAATAAS